MILYAAADTGITIDPALISALATSLAAAVGIGTWWLTKRAYKTEEQSTFVDDALKLQQAAQSAYDEIEERLAKLMEDSKIAQENMDSLRKDFEQLKEEVEHWRGVAVRARDDYRTKNDRDPFWWETYKGLE